MKKWNATFLLLLLSTGLGADNLFPVKVGGKYGFIDQTGKIRIPPRFDALGIGWGFYEGLAAVYEKGKGCGYIDEIGQYIIKLQYSECYPFHEGRTVVVSEKFGPPDCIEHRYVIDTKGAIIFGPSTDHFSGFSEGTTPIDRGGMKTCDGPSGSYSYGKFGYIDLDGKEILAPELDYASPFRNGVAVVRKGKLYGVINRNFKEIVPFEYDQIGLFSEGLAIVEKNSRFGVVNEAGGFEIQMGLYDLIQPFYDGVAQACLPVLPNQKRSGCDAILIDRKGNIVLKINHLHLDYFHEGLVSAAKRNRPESKGFIDKKGEWVVQPKYYKAYEFHNGLAEIFIKDKKNFHEKQGYIDRTGKIIWEPSD